MINPLGVEHQVHGNVIQSTSRVLKEQVSFDSGAVTSREWGAYPILTFAELPKIDTVLMVRPDEPPLGAGESASVPSAAAIANAIFDATGVRLRAPPFTPERVRAALAGAALPAPDRPRPAQRSRARGWLGTIAAGFAAALGLAVTALPWRPAYGPIPRPDPAVYAAGMIEQGRILAHLGDCAVCHDAPSGQALAGGRAIQTPFGVVYASNITPDAEAGIGAWSYRAFARAMREGISRNGRHVYPAHPYTAFSRMTEADLKALYAFLMTQAPSSERPPRTALPFPFNLRPLLAGWNSLFLRPSAFAPDPARSALWNRGAYLVEGLGHCAACHSPRNALGAERGGARHLSGGLVEGWSAPALNAASLAPLPWTEEDYFAYLSSGQSPHHGVAAGPMAAVVAELAQVPAEDLKAMAHYLASFQSVQPGPSVLDAWARDLQARAADYRPATAHAALGATLYAGACAVCHEADGPLLFGAKPALALNSNLHAATPDNLIRVVLDGILAPPHVDHGAMPGFAASFDDAQVAALADYLRSRFAPDRPAWEGIEATIARLRGVIARP
jgi:nicotinate dehydrogenase subunit B